MVGGRREPCPRPCGGLRRRDQPTHIHPCGAPLGRAHAPDLDPMGEGSVMWVSRGINGVPAVVVEGKWLISGGQPAGVFEEALRGMAGEVP